ncbi:DegT/DnrJ/EryC1/StrS family aminotransferase [Puniceibacterium sediminis]|uniref:dTDP-4-amino-4,6-dideoxygalactose transaminase n=1 Tax=Puniceibacterium sediminis TaxID=1608407 RepID=A0A238ZT88_9RHOB|nr:DegT/DnrJ/EryC1/StrS family aminotransferase [Puniceibacterium sediminis]SNR86570.1 dTDP-4-amino-4,6-dideoxygalactose transaminase [Puniceibacterium sediminis]
MTSVVDDRTTPDVGRTGVTKNLARDLAAVMAATRISHDDGLSWVEHFERSLVAATGAADAVVVSTDAAMLTVLLGAFGAQRGDSIVNALPKLPSWIAGAATLAGVKYIDVGQASLSPSDNAQRAYVFQLNPPGHSSNVTLPNVVLATDLDRCDWARALRRAQILMVPLTQGQPISTGEGGALLFNDPRLAERARTFAQFGRLDGITPGVNHKLSAVQAALGQARLDGALSQRDAQAVPPIMTRSQHGCIPDRFDPTTPADAPMLERALTRDLSGQGETVSQYEAALAHWFDADYAIAVSSGYAAVLTALLALDLRPGDEVLLTPSCPLCTVYALTAIGVIPVFCDTTPDGFSIDLDAARRAVGPHTRAVIEVPMWGYPVPAEAVAAFTKAHGLRFVLDLALGHGIELNGRHIWRNADLATFSTHASKVMVTGEGGFVLASDPALANRLQQVRSKTVEPLIGYSANFNLSGLQAALGLARLPLLQGHLQKRRAVMAQISMGLNHTDLEPFSVISGGIPSGVKMLVRHRHGAGKALNAHLAACGVPSDILTYNCRPLYEFPILAGRRTDCPNAARLLASVATLPVHPDITQAHIAQMIDALNTMPRKQAA